MTISRVTITDYVGFGKLIAQWATDPASRPLDIDAMRRQCKDLAHIPDRIKTLELVESKLDNLVIKIPPKEMVEESQRIIPGLSTYPVPTYYYQKFMNGASLSNEDFLYCRIADYTIGQCM
jgi:hypothetical protein